MKTTHDDIIEDVRKVMETIRNATGLDQSNGLMANIETFKAMGIDAKKYGEHRGGGIYYVRDQRK